MADPTRLVHQAGPVRYRKANGTLVVISTGFPLCCSGDRAWKVRRAGNYTYFRDEVTCKKCLRALANEVTDGQ